MEIKFLIENKKADGKSDIPKLGIVEGYIQEGINQITLIELVVVSDWELDEAACEKLIGQNTLLALSDLIDGELVLSRFDGVIFELSVIDEYRVENKIFAYKLIIRPPVWKLNFQTQYHSFSNTSRIDVIDEIFKTHQLEKSVKYNATYFAASKHFPKLSQIVQSETTDLVFLQQLLSEGGINYYFSATKDGENPEVMILVDHNAFFKNIWKNKILWNPPTGMMAPQRVTSLATHIHTTPASVKTTADFGDGMVQTFAGAGDVSDGKGGKHVLFSREGQDPEVPKHTAEMLTDSFVSSKVTYEGRSNHLLIRSGEKVTIKGNSEIKEKEILIVSARHTFKQSVPAAMTDNAALSYENVFSAVRKDAPIRPPQFGSTHLLSAISSQRDKSLSHYWDKLIKKLQEELGVTFNLDLGEFPYFNVQQTLLTLLDRLTRLSSSTGVWVGEVIESAKVTAGGELVCQIANEQFPVSDKGGGVTAKVALGWLTHQGWLSLLPRKGNYVYFLFMQGEGGQNEAVVVGYRSTGTVKTLDPDKTQKTPKLAIGDPPELGKKAGNVVEKAEYEPYNRNRNTLRGEKGVAEVAVIYGGDDAVAIHADKGIHMVADSEIHMDAPIQCQNADELHQQFVTVNRGVADNQKESIGGNHAMTVMGIQNIFIGGSHKTHVENEITIDNNGKEDITIANGENTSLVLHQDEQAVLKADDSNYLSIKKSGAIDMQAGGEVNIGAGSYTTVINKDGVKLTVGGNSVTVSKSGSIEISATGAITISGGQVEINGKAKVTITGGPEVSLTGAVVNIN